MTAHSIKIKRAAKLARIGDCPRSWAAMLAYVPADALAALTARHLAAVVDGLWSCAQTSKAIANSEAIIQGAVWDATRQMHRGLAPLANAAVE